MVTRNRVSESDDASASAAGARGGKSRKRLADDPWAALKKAWRAVGQRLPEMRDDLSCYAAVQADRARLAASQVVNRVVLGLLLLIVAAAVFCIASSLVIVGIAGGVASALDGNLWLANLLTGMGALVVLFLAIAILVRVRQGKRLRRLMRRYERHEARQRSMPQTSKSEAGEHAERS